MFRSLSPSLWGLALAVCGLACQSPQQPPVLPHHEALPVQARSPAELDRLAEARGRHLLDMAADSLQKRLHDCWAADSTLVVLLWDDTCQSCAQQWRHLESVQMRHGNKVAVYAVGIGEDKRRGRAFMLAAGTLSPALLLPAADVRNVCDSLGLMWNGRLPYFGLLQGELRHDSYQLDADAEELQAMLAPLLALE